MSSQGHATDLSMDEILASIRKIISEDPKQGTVTAPPRAAATDGKLNTAHTARENLPVRQIPDVNAPLPSVEQTSSQQGGRSFKPALDDDILDLMDEDKEPVAAVGISQANNETPDSALAKAPQAAPSARPGLSEMWTPREWSKPAAAVATEPAAAANPPSAAPTVTANAVEPTEAGLEAAIAALGQSLASSQPSAPPVRPFAAAAALKAPPGPRIDVVAVVNAATRAALGQRSADEQMAMPVSAVSSPPPAVAEAQPRPHATVAPPVPKSAESVPARQGPVGAPVEAPVAPTIAAPVVAPAVNAAVEAALAAARAAPPRAEVAKAPEMPRPTEMARPPEPVAAAKPSPESAPVKAAVPAQTAVVEAPKRIIPVSVSPASSVSVPITPSSSNPTASVAAATLPHSVPAGGVQTLEDTVARLLRPMLRQWLDDNMPRIVEKAFKEELAAQAAPPPSAPRIAN
jgi:cell pole-organizing protein PopZ